jgi:hypothetical protein
LARALSFLPLALSHAGAYCAAGTSFGEYLQLLEALPAAELFDDHPEVFYAQTVASTWQVSIQAAEREAPLARKVLAMAAHLAPDAIPRELFEVLLDDASTAAARKRLLDAFKRCTSSAWRTSMTRCSASTGCCTDDPRRLGRRR